MKERLFGWSKDIIFHSFRIVWFGQQQNSLSKWESTIQVLMNVHIYLLLFIIQIQNKILLINIMRWRKESVQLLNFPELSLNQKSGSGVKGMDGMKRYITSWSSFFLLEYLYIVCPKRCLFISSVPFQHIFSTQFHIISRIIINIIKYQLGISLTWPTAQEGLNFLFDFESNIWGYRSETKMLWFLCWLGWTTIFDFCM